MPHKPNNSNNLVPPTQSGGGGAAAAKNDGPANNMVDLQQHLQQHLQQQAAAGNINASIKANYIDRGDIRPTRKRYLILLLFCLHSAINAAQWILLSSITDLVRRYYQVDNLAINWTSLVYMVVYIPLVVPSTWLFERIGMRNSIVLGSLGTSLGSLVKCFSCRPGRFPLLMAGQTLVAASQLFVLSVPPRLASVWFPDHQVSLATACGVFGNQLGIALGFVVPQLVMSGLDGGGGAGGGGPEAALAADADQATAQLIGAGLFRLFLGIALVSSLVSLLIVGLFDQTPSKAPGLARLQQMKQEEAQLQELQAAAGVQPLVLAGAGAAGPGPQSLVANATGSPAPPPPPPGGFIALLRDLMSDPNFVLLMVSYGLNVGAFYAIATVLNQMIAPHWGADGNALVGRLGLVMVVAGMFGSVVSGLVLDRTRLYRLVNVGLYGLSLAAMCLFALCLELSRSLAALYAAVALLGYSMTGYLFIGYEMSNEITWPRPESVTAGLLNLSAQVFGVIQTYLSSPLVDHLGNLAANLFFIVSISVGLLVTLLIKAQLKRQSAMDS